MSNAERKARKRSGLPFVREPKVGTPLAERAVPWVRDEATGLNHPSRRAIVRALKRSLITEEEL
jgi:hypothetical protein